MPGDSGLQAASQPEAGIYIAPLYYGYRGVTIRDKNGNPITIDPDRHGSLDVNGYGIGILHITDKTLFGGGTYYFDEAKSRHFSTLAAYEFHSEKDGTDIRVGDILTLDGGLGKSFMEGAASVGLAYYARWKVTDDDFGGDLDLKKTLFGFMNVRYLWEFDVQNSVEGNILVVTLSFPWGRVPLQ